MVIQSYYKTITLSLGMLLGFTAALGMVLASSRVFADDTSVVDELNITVPMSCTMTGTGMDSHSAEINNGLYRENIGTTTLHAFCNDTGGFAIYAAGYTGDEVGGENSNKLVGATAGIGNIDSGTATSAGNPDVSSWAMKLAISQDSGDTTGANAFTIDSAPNVDLPSQAEQSASSASFSQYHVVPNEYVKVAHKDSATDMTTTTGGVKLTTTYAAYISKTQPAGNYSGKVKYTLVHPSTAPVPGSGVHVTYNSGELQFAGGATTNQVDYIADCDAIYQGNEPEISKTPNVNNDGTISSGYAYNTAQTDPVTISGADRLKVEIDYGIEEEYDFLYVFEGTYSGEVTDGPMEAGQVATLTGGTVGSGTESTPGQSTTLYIDGDTVTFAFFSDDYQDDGHYGYYAKVYPIYNTEQANTTPVSICSIADSIGTYIEPNHFKGTWTMGANTFTDEEEIKAYINEHAEEIASTGLTITAGNPYAIVYDGNTASAGTMNGFVTIPDPANPNDASGVNNTVDLMAPNFKKTGYGFAGWSENPNAAVNTNDTIYGPNQNINAGTLTYDEDNNKSAVLYAVWVQSSGNMQNFSCSSLSANQVTALTDTRDNNVYTVGKQADGNCWMMENLRLADEDNNGNNVVINSSNTNNPASGFSLTQSTDDWCTEYDNSDCVNQVKLNTNNTNLGGANASNIPLINGPGQYNGSNAAGGTKGSEENHYSWYSYGNYYNWYTATAGTGIYAQTSGNATGSICPSGWALPSGWQSSSDKGQFSVLDSAMGGTGEFQSTAEASNRWRSYPANFIYSGFWWGSVADERGLLGNYWSRTAGYIDDIANYVRYQHFDSEEVKPDNGYGYKQSGFSVRCLSLGS